jgi:mono/diheme cytochrome c family protein/plastocyanin
MSERFARYVLVGLLLGISIVITSAQATHLKWADNQPLEMRALMPELGGWMPDTIHAQVGQPLSIRFTSDDVVHGFAVGQMDWPSVEIFPGQWSETTLVFDQPGKYTYYCTRWCGPNHWRMRGVIEVDGPGSTAPAIDPLYVILGIDIDAPHLAETLPQQKPSARRGMALNVDLPARYLTQDYYRANSPEEIWTDLRSKPGYEALNDQQIWDLVAVIWMKQVIPESLPADEMVFASNCAACHGGSGGGDGVLAPWPVRASDKTPAAQRQQNEENSGQKTPTAMHQMGHANQVMPDFNDPRQVLGASPALLQGKIIRGGMGTGMPYFGPILTEEQTWALVAYIQSFHFEME